MDGSAVLKKACQDLNLSWDHAMVRWPKKLGDIVYLDHPPNETFASSLGGGDLVASIHKTHEFDSERVPTSELRWLEKEFSAYNAFHNYPVEVPSGGIRQMAPPRFEGTARDWCYGEIERLRNENYLLGSKIRGVEKA